MPRETGRTGYKTKLIKTLNELFPGCTIMHNNAAHKQGVPDMTIFYGERWAMLEVKAAENSPRQPNQEYWVNFYNEQSFESFIYPENEEEVLNALQHALAPRGITRNSKR